ncbi:DUF3606 domain-containing protein [Aquincola sp. S2]|uniref:DUF3606 domain-containing protein n=1 Tax=Pseudaquabacterium terrae TaxID=2732868 RepID=A0ABX2EHR1_9BURK|nr:DUF3606 domain-containing protein [Aquabacterium terrae]NRF68190.1 DUF3606 domain-containing protein [Aquabacterium terrae]
MNIPQRPPTSANPYRPQVLLEPPWRLAYWTRVLDSDEDELRRVVDEVGCQAQRVCARLWELRQSAS